MTPLAKLLEAALFAAPRPIPMEALAALDVESSPAAVAAALDALREHYDVDGHGVELVEQGGGWQILTRAEFAEAIERAAEEAHAANRAKSSFLATVSHELRNPLGVINTRLIAGNLYEVLTILEEGGCDIAMLYDHPIHPVAVNPALFESITVAQDCLQPFSAADHHTQISYIGSSRIGHQKISGLCKGRVAVVIGQ